VGYLTLFEGVGCTFHNAGFVQGIWHSSFFSCRRTLEGYRILYSILEYSPLQDSSNMSMEDWAKIARDIHKHYKLFNGFVILHGTDTLAYTASALSFMFENLGKTIILSGSQVCHRSKGFRSSLCGSLEAEGVL